VAIGEEICPSSGSGHALDAYVLIIAESLSPGRNPILSVMPGLEIADIDER
jgi:hypothetical protein